MSQLNHQGALRSERTFLHDLSSPVSALQLNLDAFQEECLEKGLLPPDLVSLLSDAVSNSNRILQLIRDRREELIAAGVPSDRVAK